MWYMYLYSMCIYYLSKFITSKSISPPRSDLALGKSLLASYVKLVCAQIYSPLSDGPFYEPLGRLRRHMAPNGFNNQWMQQTLINIPYREIYCRRKLTAVVVQSVECGWYDVTRLPAQLFVLYKIPFHIELSLGYLIQLNFKKCIIVPSKIIVGVVVMINHIC